MPFAPLKPYVPVFKWIILVQALIIVAFVGLYLFKDKGEKSVPAVDTEAGIEMNKQIWEASFRERALSVPAQGPREGYWGVRLSHQTYDSVLGWRHSEQDIPGLVSIDADGLQHARSNDPDAFRMLILGGSVAFGAYASDEGHTYFSELQRMLSEQGVEADITVAATGAWKSEQSVAALMKHFDQVKPDAVLFFNGLNSLTNGANASTRYGEEVETEDGSVWSPLYHERDYEARTQVYFDNMMRARSFADEQGVPIFFVLQPALFEKKNQTWMEQELWKVYKKFLGPSVELKTSYDKMRTAMRSSAKEDTYFLDLSKAFDDEKTTTFADMWHFSDPGHRIVAEKMAAFLGPIINDLDKR